ncbi:thioredoxin domain-containing protein [Conexibacter sp. W3-3-2]|uniref:DsbA family protein n=1 Tax=Conexibacter sp. W3-3-2 TaxID=2675227 RepID=UPI0012BA0C2E|nr:thioredoxin domain-containing protein [Conexibacter sp. W3-3-2]MTD47494.1 thioredoxin domain-containing protein [Conexibacter sp. W3-3-2]
MSTNLKISGALVAFALAVIIGLAIASGDSDEPAAAKPSPQATASTPVVRADTHKLDVAADGKVTLVEFLDFECEACGAVYPLIEELRRQYDGRLTFAIRYFPLPGHRNGKIAAQAVEAASKQDKLEPMYKRMYETQKEWGESKDSKKDVFIGYAEDLGLDMTKFRADLESPETIARIEKDMQDGANLGVVSTPTLFLNGEMMNLESAEQLQADIEAAFTAE